MFLCFYFANKPKYYDLYYKFDLSTIVVFNSKTKVYFTIFISINCHMVHLLRFTATTHTHTQPKSPCASPGRKDKDARKAGHRLYPNFTPVTEGRSMKDACGCLVLESFNTTRGVRVGRQHEAKARDREAFVRKRGR